MLDYTAAALCNVCVLTLPAPHVMSAPEAAELVGITYRQLDYWGRKGWVVPGSVERVSSSRRLRRYGEVDVLRLGALAHLARSGLDVAAYGPAVGQLDLGQLDLGGADPLAVVGPTGELEVVSSAELRAKVCVPGRFVVFDPLPLREAFASRFAALAPVSDLTKTERRSA
jgi:DNA-binding transcriptional MerR regulator